MQPPSPYCWRCPPSHPNVRGSAGQLDFQTLPYPYPHPHPNGQGDEFSSSLNNSDTHNDLLPRQHSLDDIIAEVQYNLSIKNVQNRNFVNPSVHSTTNFSFTEDLVQGPTVDHNAHSLFSASTHNTAPKAASFSDVSYQEPHGWQKQSGTEAFGQPFNSQNVAYRSYLPTDATSLYNLNIRGFGNQKDLAPHTSNVGCYGSSSTSIASHPSAHRLAPRETYYNNYTNLEPSTISSPVHPSPRKRKPAQPKCSRAPGRPRRGRPPKNNNRRRKPSCKSTPCNKTPEPPPSLAPVVPEPESNPDPYEEFVKRYTTIFDDEEQQSSNDLDLPNCCEQSSLNAPSACHVDYNTVEDDPPPCIGHCCSIRPVLDAVLQERPQPRTVSQARSKSHQKRQNQRSSNGIRKNISTNKRRVDPRQLFYCTVPTCNYSLKGSHGGLKTAEDYKRHMVQHEDKKILCWVCGRAFYRLDNLRT